MKSALEKYKGIHPGFILEHELRKRGIAKRQFAFMVNEHAQTLNSITKGSRKLTPDLSFRIDEVLELEQGTMLFLQTHYEIAEYNKQHHLTLPKTLSKIRKVLFWDTDFNSIDWIKNAEAVIRRVYERGNEEEKQAVKNYYGLRKIKTIIT